MKHYIDLHLHLDGSVPIDTLAYLMKKHNYSALSREQLLQKSSVSHDCQDLNEYLTKFDFPLQFMQEQDDLEIIVFDLLKQLRQEGLIYVEIRFAPQLHTKHGLSQDQAIASCLNGLNDFYVWQAKQNDTQPDLHANFLLCLMRFADNQKQNMESVLLAHKYQNNHVVGIDLAGPEGIIPNIEYKAFFDKARQLDLNYTIHAGEAAGPDSIRQALKMGATRIGHGIRCLEDSDLVAYLALHDITLECCATSNLNTKIFTQIDSYPIRTLLDNHLKATLNCDNMTVSQTSLKREYQILVEKIGLTKLERHQLLYNSITAAFTTLTEKERLYNILVKP